MANARQATFVLKERLPQPQLMEPLGISARKVISAFREVALQQLAPSVLIDLQLAEHN